MSERQNQNKRIIVGAIAAVLVLLFCAVGWFLWAAPTPLNQSCSPVPGETAKDSTISVTVQIDSSAADSSVSNNTSMSLETGATAYDALMACGLSVESSQSSMGAYVTSIEGLAQKDHGESSGWLYSVNGTDATTSCDACVLQDGDVVTWTYVVG